jgi:hypothetical protein
LLSNLCILNFHIAVSHSVCHVFVCRFVHSSIGRYVHILIRPVHQSLFLNLCLSLSLFIYLYHLATYIIYIYTYVLYISNISICVLNQQFIYMHPFIHMHPFIYVHPFICPSIHPSICYLYAHLPFYRSTCPTSSTQ